MIKELITQRVKLFEVEALAAMAEELVASPTFPGREAENIELIRKFYTADEKASQEGLAEGQVRHTITTAAVDRDGEIMKPKGADLKWYKKNPVVLWSHDYRVPGNIIGKNVSLERTDTGIKATTQFKMDLEEAAKIYGLYKDGYLNAWSVGFVSVQGKRPTEKEIDELVKGGIIIIDDTPVGKVRYIHEKWQLLEYSSVAVPANPEALTEAVAKSYGLSEELVKQLGIEIEELEIAPGDGKTILDLGDIGDLEVADDGKSEEESKAAAAKAAGAEGEADDREPEAIKADLVNQVTALDPPAEWLAWAGQQSSDIKVDGSLTSFTYGGHDFGFNWKDNTYIPAWPNDTTPWEDTGTGQPWKINITPAPDDEAHIKVTKELWEDMAANIKALRDEIAGLKAGRVLSAKNRELISKAAGACTAAAEALSGLLKATEPAPDAGDGDDGEKGLDIEGLCEKNDFTFEQLLEAVEKTVDIEKLGAKILGR